MALPTQKIWDWDVIEALYLGGMEQKDILKIPKFRGLSPSYLAKKVSENRWKDRRDAARAEGTGQIARPLIVKMGEAEEQHQKFMIDRLKTEREILEKEANRKGGKDQVERLNILKQIDDLSRRLLGLDDRKPLNDNQRNLGILIQINQNGGPRPKGESVSVSVQPAPIVKTVVMTAAEAEAQKLIEEFREQQGQMPEEELPRPDGLKPISPFKVKEITPEPSEPLVNESGEKDIVEIFREAGYDARVISEGNQQ